jgi:hypothetical protein
MIRTFKPPLFAWLTVLVAMAAGMYGHITNPMGGFVDTPWDWCSPKTHSFGLLHLLVLSFASLILVFAVVGAWILKACNEDPTTDLRLASFLSSSFRSGVVFAIAMSVTPIFERLLPLEPDPRCASVRPISGKAALPNAP